MSGLCGWMTRDTTARYRPARLPRWRPGSTRHEGSRASTASGGSAPSPQRQLALMRRCTVASMCWPRYAVELPSPTASWRIAPGGTVWRQHLLMGFPAGIPTCFPHCPAALRQLFWIGTAAKRCSPSTEWEHFRCATARRRNSSCLARLWTPLPRIPVWRPPSMSRPYTTTSISTWCRGRARYVRAIGDWNPEATCGGATAKRKPARTGQCAIRNWRCSRSSR